MNFVYTHTHMHAHTHTYTHTYTHRWQTKPKMSIHGDLYYEGKEFETKLKDKKPGDLSDELRAALGMPTGPVSGCPISTGRHM